jgi:hypothetical protein
MLPCREQSTPIALPCPPSNPSVNRAFLISTWRASLRLKELSSSFTYSSTILACIKNDDLQKAPCASAFHPTACCSADTA